MSDGVEQAEVPLETRVGEQLAAERGRQQLELADVASRLRIPLRHLEAIEAGEHSALPALPYSAGFVKSYANMLGLDGVALSKTFRDEVGNEQRGYFEPEAYEPVDPSRVPSRMLAMIALGVALLLGMGYLLLRFEGDSVDLAKLAADTPEEINAALPAAAVPAAPVAPPAPVIPTGPIRVAAVDKDVWVKISDRADGTTLFRGVIKAGENYEVPETAVDPILRTLLPEYVKVSIGETALPPVGPASTLVPTYSLKRDALVAIATAPAIPAAGTAMEGDNSTAPAAPQPSPDPAGSRPDTTQPISADPSPRRP
jgi:hypothetical protein